MQNNRWLDHRRPYMEVDSLARAFLESWNSHEPERVLAHYTEDCVYLDPNTRGAIHGHEPLRKYLRRLFEQWRMTWSLTEAFVFANASGGAFLWQAQLAPVTGGEPRRIGGMDLVVFRGDRVARNEVYFDRA